MVRRIRLTLPPITAVREEFESTIGRLEYSIGKHEKLIHATVQVTFKNITYNENKDMKFYLLLFV
jgi:hypothetical protein